MNLITHKYGRFIPAIYFMLLGAFSMLMDLQRDTVSAPLFCVYAIGFLPLAIPVKHFWMYYGLIVSSILTFFLLMLFGWFVQYLNGTYFRYPFDTFVVGFAFITFSLLCAISLLYTGVKSKKTILVRLRA